MIIFSYTLHYLNDLINRTSLVPINSDNRHSTVPLFSRISLNRVFCDYKLRSSPNTNLFRICNVRGDGGIRWDHYALIVSTTYKKGKYELRPAVKKLYQLRSKVSASRVSVASRVVNPKHDELRPAVTKELHQLHWKMWVYKMSNNWKVLTQFYCTVLYTELYAHIQNCWMIPTTQLLCYGLMFKPY
jgi:hypothetical protein